MMKDEGLRAYADLLEANGFAIYEPKTPTATWFTYSQVRDGRECFGHVTLEHFGGYSHTMPIRPSVAFGSAMVVHGAVSPINHIGVAELTVAEAKQVARPSNRGPYVEGWHQNFMDPRWLESGYTLRIPAVVPR